MPVYQECILFLLSKAYQKASGIFKSKVQRYGITPVQNLFIAAISENPGISASELSKKLLIDNATTSGVVDRLFDAGWIMKTLDEKDKRNLRICLTEKSKSLLDQLTQAMEEANQEVLKEFSLEEKLLFKRFLKEI